MDARRSANKQGLTLMGPTKIFYARVINAGMLYAQQHGVFRAYNDLAFDRFWRRDLDPESVEAVGAALEQAGAPSGFAAFLDGEGGARHDALRAEAEASGIFGVPSFVLDGEIFWGGDRVSPLRERLRRKRRAAPPLGLRSIQCAGRLRSWRLFTSPRCLRARSLICRLARRNASFTAKVGSAKRSSSCDV